MRPSRIVMVESPFNHPTLPRVECVRYALWACLDATRRGECVFASHLLYTQFLPEDKVAREWGLMCRDMIAKATIATVARYTDIGQTPDMFRDVDCTAIVDSRTLGEFCRAGWTTGKWPEASIRVGVVG